MDLVYYLNYVKYSRAVDKWNYLAMLFHLEGPFSILYMLFPSFW